MTTHYDFMSVTKRRIFLRNFKYVVIKSFCRHFKNNFFAFQDMPVLIGQKLASPITLDIYGTHNQALIQGKKLTSATIPKGTTVPIYISPLSSDKLVILKKEAFSRVICIFLFQKMFQDSWCWPVLFRDYFVLQR